MNWFHGNEQNWQEAARAENISLSNTHMGTREIETGRLSTLNK